MDVIDAYKKQINDNYIKMTNLSHKIFEKRESDIGSKKPRPIVYSNSIYSIPEIYKLPHSKFENIRQSKMKFLKFADKIYNIKSEVMNSSPDTVHHIRNTDLINDLNPRQQKLINEELDKLYDVYYSRYNGVTEFYDLRTENDKYYYKDRDDKTQRYYNNDTVKNQQGIVKDYKDRLNDLKQCAQKNDSRVNLYNFLIENMMSLKSEDYISICENIKWGYQHIANRPYYPEITPEQLREIVRGYTEYNKLYGFGKPDSLVEEENRNIKNTILGKYFLTGEHLPNTFETGRKQYVFGHAVDLAKYFQDSEHYVCLPHPAALAGRNSCGNMAEWSLQLNMMYTLCAIHSKHKFIRFVMPVNSIFPEKQRMKGAEVSDFTIFTNLPVGCLLFKYKENRKGKYEEKYKKTYLLIYVFYNLSQLDYKNTTNKYTAYRNTGITLYTDLKKNVNYGEIFYSSLISYNEFTMIKCDTSTMNMSVYRHKLYPRILFFTKRIHIPDSVRKYVTELLTDPYNNKIRKKCIESSQNLIMPLNNTLINFLSFDKQKITKALQKINEYGIIYDSDISGIMLIDIKCDKIIKSTSNIPERVLTMNLYPNQITDYHRDLIKRNKAYVTNSEEKIIFSNKPLYGGAYSIYELELKIDNLMKNAKYSFGDAELLNEYSIEMYRETVKYFKREECTINKLYDPLMFISDYLPRGKLITYDQTYDRKYKNKFGLHSVYMLLEKNVNRIVLYKNLSHHFFSRYEILVKTNLINDGLTIAVYSQPEFDFIEALHYYNIKYAIKNTKITGITDPNFSNLPNYENSIAHLKQFINFNIIYSEQIIKYTEKHDIVISDYIIRMKYDKNGNKIEQKYDSAININSKSIDQSNYIIRGIYQKPILDSILFALEHLKEEGNFILFIADLDTKFKCDLILLTSMMFSTYELILCDKQSQFKMSHTFVLFKGFKYNIDLIEKIKKLYEQFMKFTPKDINEFTVYDPSKGIYGLLKLSINNEEYDIFKQYNLEIYKKKYQYFKLLCNMDEKTEKLLLEQAYYKSLEYAKKYDFEVLEMFKSDVRYNYLNQFYYDLLTPNNSFNIKFDKMFAIKNITFDVEPIELLKYDKTRYDLLLVLIDTRNINDYFKYKQYVRYYKPHESFNLDLRMIVQNKFNTGKISQAWLKMYEILVEHPNILQTQNDTFNTFHICEAPGNFIAAINHYIKTKTNKKFNWYANSLNPKTTNANVGDQNGYIKKYPEKWLFGSDNTGDITKYENLAYYSNFIKKNKINFVTSDCGLPASLDDSNEMLRVHLAEFVLIMKSLNEGGNFVAKFFFPLIRPLELYIIYCLYKSFGELSIYKPIINIYSSEFYLIGKNYSGVGYDIDILYDLISPDKFNPNFKPSVNIDNNFLRQLCVFNKKLIDDYSEHFKKQLFYVDYRETFPDSFISQMKYNISRKNDEWISKMNLFPIHTNQRL